MTIRIIFIFYSVSSNYIVENLNQMVYNTSSPESFEKSDSLEEGIHGDLLFYS